MVILNNKGQAVAFDIILIFLCISIFTAGVFAFTFNLKAPLSQAQRSRMDYTKSLLITALYTTPNPGSSRSLSDIIAMHVTNMGGPDENPVPVNMVIKNLKAAKIDQYLAEKGVGANTEWFLEGEFNTDDQGLLGFLAAAQSRRVCFHGKGSLVEVCGEPVEARETTTAAANLVYIDPSTQTLFLRNMNFFLTIKWS